MNDLFLARVTWTRCLTALMALPPRYQPRTAILDLQDRLGGREIATLHQDIKYRIAQHVAKQLIARITK